MLATDKRMRCMQGFAGERVLMRIHVSEADRFDGDLVYRRIIDLLRARQFAGATAFRGAMSFGASSVVHSDQLEAMSVNLPVIIECVDSEEKIMEILPDLDRMIGGGLITLERAEVIVYRPHDESLG